MTLVEKMARAIDAAEVAWCSQHQDKSAADMPDTLKAIAALKAMLEAGPTYAMECAFDCDMDAGGKYVDEGPTAEEGWRAMIRAAIKEAEGE